MIFSLISSLFMFFQKHKTHLFIVFLNNYLRCYRWLEYQTFVLFLYLTTGNWTFLYTSNSLSIHILTKKINTAYIDDIFVEWWHSMLGYCETGMVFLIGRLSFCRLHINMCQIVPDSTLPYSFYKTKTLHHVYKDTFKYEVFCWKQVRNWASILVVSFM